MTGPKLAGGNDPGQVKTEAERLEPISGSAPESALQKAPDPIPAASSPAAPERIWEPDPPQFEQGAEEDEEAGAEVNPPAIPPPVVRPFRPRAEQKANLQQSKPVNRLPAPGRKLTPAPGRKPAAEITSAPGRKATPALGRKRLSASGEGDVGWLKGQLPETPESGRGWWSTSEDGKGFRIRFRWDVGQGESRETPTLGFARISKRQFQKLKEMSDYERRDELREWIAGQLDEIQYDAERGGKARLVAARIGIELENNRDVSAKHLAS